MLPEIVRAAAEPIGNIGSLTVLSSDGAADVVKTTTRTVAEASTAVKGLTGIDVPALLANAMGTAYTNGGPVGSPKPGSGGAGGGGGRRRPSTVVTPAMPVPPAPVDGPTGSAEPPRRHDT